MKIMEKIKKINLFRFNYNVLKISVVLFVVTLLLSIYDVRRVSKEVAQDSMKSDAEMVAGYVEDFFDSRTASLELLSESLMTADYSNTAKMNRIVSAYSSFFDSITIVDVQGMKVYGEDLGTDTAVQLGFQRACEGKSAVSDVVTKNVDGDMEVRIYVPVKDNLRRVRHILVGTVSVSRIAESFGRITQGQNVCMAVMNSRGRVLFGTANAYSYLGKSGTSYFSYLRECDIKSDENIDVEYFQKKMRKRQRIYLIYNKDHRVYSAVCSPININKGYIIYMSTGCKESYIENIISSKTMGIIEIFLLDVILVFVLLIYNASKLKRANRLLENHAIIEKQERSVVFVYTFLPKKKIEVFGDFKSLFGRDFETLYGEAVFDVYDYIHEDDKSIRGRLHKFFDGKETVFSSEIRAKYVDGTYNWFRLTGTIFRDKRGRNIRFVGKMVNANTQISMEKSLVERAENDMLTGVLNKKTMESRISELLEQPKEDRFYIFYMVDLDNFKNVNDTLGHIYGDKAIADTANELTKIFHSNALIGRLGGDEFAVCATYDAFDEKSLYDYIREKAEKVCAANRRSYTDSVNTVSISSSVGIAVAPIDGNNFETIYKLADDAVYNSKKTGKNKYTVYSRKKNVSNINNVDIV